MAMKMPELWELQQVEPIPLLAKLRENVLRQNDGKRCPKWAFRLAGDLAVQLQPRPTLLAIRPGSPQRALEFLGLAHHEVGDDLPQNVFKSVGKDLEIRGAAWCRASRSRCSPTRAKTSGHSRPRRPVAARSLLARITCFSGAARGSSRRYPAALATLRPELMLSRSCLVCGKTLTDPASILAGSAPSVRGGGSALRGRRHVDPRPGWPRASFCVTTAVRRLAPSWPSVFYQRQGDVQAEQARSTCVSANVPRSTRPGAGGGSPRLFDDLEGGGVGRVIESGDTVAGQACERRRGAR